MIKRVTACEYLGRTLTGRAKPMQCVCECDDGSLISVYVKYENFHDDLVKDHLVGEVVANLFALDIGLPAAEPCLVQIEPEFVEMLPNSPESLELRSALGGAPLQAFGSVQLEPVRRWTEGNLVRKAQLKEAMLLYLFDTIVENSDRGRRNPNLLVSGYDFRVIDFGHSFQRCHSGESYEESKWPWTAGGILNHFDGHLQHIMFAAIRPADPVAIAEFTTTLKCLNDDKIMSYIGSVPETWGHDTACKIIDYLIEARDHADEFAEQVRRVLQ